jgi:hypothetical protein
MLLLYPGELYRLLGASSLNFKPDCHNVTEILLKVALKNEIFLTIHFKIHKKSNFLFSEKFYYNHENAEYNNFVFLF